MINVAGLFKINVIKLPTHFYIPGAAQLYRLQRFSYRRVQGAHNLSQKRCKQLYYAFILNCFLYLYYTQMVNFSLCSTIFQLTTLDSAKTLDELKLCPQETVILEERHEDSD